MHVYLIRMVREDVSHLVFIDIRMIKESSEKNKKETLGHSLLCRKTRLVKDVAS